MGLLLQLLCKVTNASVYCHEVALIKINTTVKQLIHLALNVCVDLVLRVIEGTELVTEFVDKQIFQLQPLAHLSQGKLLLDGVLDLVHCQRQGVA